MTTRTFARFCLLLVLAAFTSNCGTVKGWIFGKKNVEKSPEVMAQEGINKLKKKNYDDAIDIFEKMRDRYPYSDQALLAQIKVADAYFYKKKYDEALHAYREFEKLHPTNKAIPYVIYHQGLCYYRQRSTIDRDQSFTLKALNEFRRLQQKFPRSQYAKKAEKYTARCRRDLAEHEFYVGEFYYRTKHYQAALDRFQAVAQEYPEFSKKAQCQKYIAECQKILTTPEKKRKGGILSKVTSIFDANW
jgi:outer membrane protein assembly factor BamD